MKMIQKENNTKMILTDDELLLVAQNKKNVISYIIEALTKMSPRLVKTLELDTSSKNNTIITVDEDEEELENIMITLEYAIPPKTYYDMILPEYKEIKKGTDTLINYLEKKEISYSDEQQFNTQYIYISLLDVINKVLKKPIREILGVQK